MLVQIITIILTATVAGIGWLLKNEIDKRREIERQLSEKKYNVYISIIELFFSIFNTVRKNKELSTEESVEKLFKIQEELIIYGSDSVLKKYSFWRGKASLNGDLSLFSFTEIILEIRKDMGNQDSKVSVDDVWGLLFTDDYQQRLADAQIAYNKIMKKR